MAHQSIDYGSRLWWYGEGLWGRRRYNERDQKLSVVERGAANLVGSVQANGRHSPALDIDYPVATMPLPRGTTLVTVCRAALPAGIARVERWLQTQGWLDADAHYALEPGWVGFALKVEVAVRASSTPGHHHVFINQSLPTPNYQSLLDALVACDLVAVDFAGLLRSYGMTCVVAPGVSKPQAELLHR